MDGPIHDGGGQCDRRCPDFPDQIGSPSEPRNRHGCGILKRFGIITFAKTDPDRSLPPPGLYVMTEKPKQEPEILNPRYAGATPEAVVLALTRRKGKFEDFETERESENGRSF